VARRAISDAPSPITSTRPTKGSATSRAATSSRTRRRSSYTHTVAPPLAGVRILSSITRAPSLRPAAVPGIPRHDVGTTDNHLDRLQGRATAVLTPGGEERERAPDQVFARKVAITTGLRFTPLGIGPLRPVAPRLAYRALEERHG
jgi:hypothetical protein